MQTGGREQTLGIVSGLHFVIVYLHGRRLEMAHSCIPRVEQGSGALCLILLPSAYAA